ncbi:cell wall-associated hydrolase, invasion-associated protein [Aequorivita sublithincola DSM 14238]|uniref:Cell wall-associated hydrolase, invasion-associated protein n=1 Tax=Aequorivita sublithincola (strain DSM 14238 / LMG 21431 / ACAM 643 / 9-3) TaxID=746697 RepID=I3YWQ1_AEQSU|nr:C40 family peptidase [Aequorivita sublithincola]AFL81419.1 cell wall-associated hydrolase, invasion-associated protein [Aequorivita sublithincola DSM 14238]
MKKLLLLSFFTLFLVSCGSTKNTDKVPEVIVNKNESKPKSVRKVNSRNNTKITNNKREEEVEIENAEESPKEIKREIIDYAKTFEGTRYKFGGTTEAGMDCSGLVYTAFQKENITLPRISRDMAKQGILISFKDIEEGDLVFFKTSRKNVITHVGLVVEAKRGEVKFIHSSTSAGVIISSLDEAYWKKAFVEVRRVI